MTGKYLMTKIIKNLVSIVIGILMLTIISTKTATANDKYVTIVNPVRGRELWRDKSLKPLQDQYKIINDLELKATWLVQNDVIEDKELVDYIKQFNYKQELGIFLEISNKLARKARVYYPINRPWYSPEAVFLSGYNRTDRLKLIDKTMKDFKNTFGYLPKSVGAWWIDSYSLNYLEKKYGITTAMIVADQKTTDDYGVWGQWWGYPYYPSINNILTPGNSKTLIIQWALRDPELAYSGSGPATSNYSLQANDYKSLGLDIKYFEKLANIYFDNRNKLGQITVGLETGMESVGFENEYNKQLEWIKNNKITDVTMAEFNDKYKNIYDGINPSEVKISEWLMTPNFRENKKLGERTDYIKEMVFRDYFEKDHNTFLDRIYKPDNLVSRKQVPYMIVLLIALIGLGGYLRTNWLVVGSGVLILKIISLLRYTMIDGIRMVGLMIDNFRFVGVTDKLRFINEDLSNLVAQSMLKIEIKETYYFIWILVLILYCLFKKYLRLGK